MRFPHLFGLTVLFLLVSALIVTPPPALGCAPAPPPNKPVQIADESAIIIWSAATKTEHFIRRASFQTKAEDFGFLVPTPTRPTLAEASDEAFSQLKKITAPAVVDRPQPAGSGCALGCSSSAPMAEKAGVDVLEEKHVAGYDAAVLAADNANSLGTWLNAHGYEFSPELVDWAGIYASQGWIVTAFKVSKSEADAPRAATSAVRMSFTTERPFFPYREPAKPAAATSTNGERLLRIFFIGEKRMEGTLGDKGEPWKGKPVWSNHIDDASYKALLKAVGLPEQTGPPSPWLTEFEDHSSPRVSGADLFFAPSTDQGTIAREPYIRYTAAWSDSIMPYAIVACLVTPVIARRLRRTKPVAV